MSIGDNKEMKEKCENKHKLILNIHKYQITINNKERD